MSLDLTAIIVAALSGMGGVFAVTQARAANRCAAMEARKVDKESAVEQRRLDMEHDRAHWERTDEIIGRLREEVARLDALLRDARARLETEMVTSAELRGRVAEYELRIIRLKAIVQLLSDELRSRGIAVPDAGDPPV